MAAKENEEVVFEGNLLKRFPSEMKGSYTIPVGTRVAMDAFRDCVVEELIVPEGVEWLDPTSLAAAKFGRVVFLSDKVGVIDACEAKMYHMSTFTGYDGNSIIEELVYNGSDSQFVRNITWGATIAVLNAPGVDVETISRGLKVPALIGYIKAACENPEAIPDTTRYGYEKAVKSARKKLFSLAADYPFLPRYILKMGYLSSKEAQSLATTVVGDSELVAMLLEYQQASSVAKQPQRAEALSSGVAASGEGIADGFEWTAVDDGIEITKYLGKAPKTLVIPDEIAGKAVISIGKGAFSKKAFEALTLPKGLKTIRSTAFSGCKKLKKVTIPATVQTIGASAFGSCWLLEEVAFSKKGALADIGQRAFSGTDLAHVEIPSTVEKIGKSAFDTPYIKTLTFLGGAKAYSFDFPDYHPIIVIDTVTPFSEFTKRKEKLSVAAGYVFLAANAKIQDIPADAASFIKAHAGQLFALILQTYETYYITHPEQKRPPIEWLFAQGYMTEKQVSAAVETFAKISYGGGDRIFGFLSEYE